MTQGPKDPGERARWKLQRYIDHYGMGADMFQRVFTREPGYRIGEYDVHGGLVTKIAENYVEQADAGNAALLQYMLDQRFIRSNKQIVEDIQGLSYKALYSMPLEVDFAAIERRIVALGPYAYNQRTTYPQFDLDNYLTATASLKEWPDARLTRMYRRLFVAGLV